MKIVDIPAWRRSIPLGKRNLGEVDLVILPRPSRADWANTGDWFKTDVKPLLAPGGRVVFTEFTRSNPADTTP